MNMLKKSEVKPFNQLRSSISTPPLTCIVLFTGNHTIAVLKTSEDYKNLRNGLANVTSTVNKLIDDGFIIMNGKKVKLQFFLGGDYKVSTMSMT